MLLKLNGGIMHTPGGDTEWDDIIEELPQTGTSIVLR